MPKLKAPACGAGSGRLALAQSMAALRLAVPPASVRRFRRCRELLDTEMH
ncbi:MAG TPA: hypothetical protein PKK06_01140 [Phycisphaerae bacterium]|nr:hypothetical protein [Phycisphaerae bacterium]HNU43787.1 hypothetical protein [Phycisphaerae bacterium]